MFKKVEVTSGRGYNCVGVYNERQDECHHFIKNISAQALSYELFAVRDLNEREQTARLDEFFNPEICDMDGSLVSLSKATCIQYA